MELEKYKYDIKYIQKKLLNWYKENGRYFPWRNKSVTNYQVIISEILLQRTKAEMVAEFYPKFINKYSSWKRLAEAEENELKQFLKPIGLYNLRGEKLYKLAQEMKKRRGQFPKERNQVEEMPMMGQYITNAYELFIMNKKSPLLDGNMARLIERFFRPRELKDLRSDPFLQNMAYKIVDINHRIEINWAILDFAALICKKNNPLCNACIIKRKCNFYKSQLIS